MNKKEIINHNNEVFKEVLKGMVESDMFDTIRLFADREYVRKSFLTYFEATNTAREMMGMEPLVIYREA